ncbi:unnamed protein product [Haemonchus placei]|uniref:Uncharacterized protein n=1 Tax=Haemonchus placei TaxID=6290 RepID=A0A0N4WTX9_HAEPC|nr:unnamed protein product [Haemonchus placei]
MKLMSDMPKPEWSMEKETEKANIEQTTPEDSISAIFSKQEPSLGSKIVNVAKEATSSAWEMKKKTCPLMPQNTPCMSNKCCLERLPGVRQLKEKIQPTKKNEA